MQLVPSDFEKPAHKMQACIFPSSPFLCFVLFFFFFFDFFALANLVFFFSRKHNKKKIKGHSISTDIRS